MPRFTRAPFLVCLMLGFGMSSAVANSNRSMEILDFNGMQSVQAVGSTYSTVSFSSSRINGLPDSMAAPPINVSAGITRGSQFYFTSALNQTVTIWSGANRKGTLLATLAISPNSLSCIGFPSYCNGGSARFAIGSGAARSITLSGPTGGFGAADIALNSSTSAIPEPSPIYLVATGLAAASLWRLRRFFRN